MKINDSAKQLIPFTLALLFTILLSTSSEGGFQNHAVYTYSVAILAIGLLAGWLWKTHRTKRKFADFMKTVILIPAVLATPMVWLLAMESYLFPDTVDVTMLNRINEREFRHIDIYRSGEKELLLKITDPILLAEFKTAFNNLSTYIPMHPVYNEKYILMINGSESLRYKCCFMDHTSDDELVFIYYTDPYAMGIQKYKSSKLASLLRRVGVAKKPNTKVYY